MQVVGINGGETSNETDASGALGFSNIKSQDWWRVREALDPRNAERTGIALPPDPELLRDLTAPLWRPVGGRIRVETREEIVKRIGRSPDWGAACTYAFRTTPCHAHMQRGPQTNRYGLTGHDPYANL